MRLLLLLLFSALIFNSNAQPWKVYPYQPEGSLVGFPEDEGFHPEEPVEWWYINGTLTGETTGKDYSFMISCSVSMGFGFLTLQMKPPVNFSRKPSPVFIPLYQKITLIFRLHCMEAITKAGLPFLMMTGS